MQSVAYISLVVVDYQSCGHLIIHILTQRRGKPYTANLATFANDVYVALPYMPILYLHGLGYPHARTCQ